MEDHQYYNLRIDIREVREKIVDDIADIKETLRVVGNRVCLPYILAGTIALVGSIGFGPIDFVRTVYNQVIGDAPALKSDLAEYARRDIRRQNPDYMPRDVERQLGNDLGFVVRGEEIKPEEISIMALWDAAEKHKRGFIDQWVWTDLDAP